eukprot:5640145-Prorocentrum_lima.AAC.1
MLRSSCCPCGDWALHMCQTSWARSGCGSLPVAAQSAGLIALYAAAATTSVGRAVPSSALGCSKP